MKRRPHNNNGGGQRHSHGGGGNNRNRRFSKPYGGGGHSSGGDDHANIGRVRKSAQANREKYQNMAHDAMRSGDRVLSEYYLQHAEHYFRVLAALPPEEQRRPQQNNGQNADGTQQQGDEQQGAQPSAEGNVQSAQNVQPPQSAPSALPAFITGIPGNTTPPQEEY